MGLGGDSAGSTPTLSTGALDRSSSGGLGSVRLVGLLGEGGMAQVYLGHHEGLDRPVAVKRLRNHLADVDQARARLRNEAAIVAGLHHESIVDVLELVMDPAGDTYLVMEHVPGEALSARLARGGALPMSETLTISVQISDALVAVHRRGIVHRDVKTENVLIGMDAAGALRSKLIDFGVAEILGSPDGVCQPPRVVGTPESMSPEQALVGPLDRRSDIYSFGVLVYEMLTGAAPFQGDDVERLMERVVHEAPLPPSQSPGASRQLIPEALERLVMACLAKRPDDRPADMEQVRAELERIAAEYRALADAVDSAVEEGTAELEPVIQEALIVVGPAVDSPLPLHAPIRAAGTSDERDTSAALARTEQTYAQQDDLPIDPDPEPAVALPRTSIAPRMATVLRERPARARARHRRRRRRRGALRAGLLFTVLAASIAGVIAYMAHSPGFGPVLAPIEDMEFPWHR
jgi:serine/threonine-protein kinase